MNEPFGPRWDLVLRNRSPYMDDDGGHDPTMPTTPYFRALLDPRRSGIPADSDQASAQQSPPQSQSPLQGIIPVPDIASQKLDNDPSGPSVTSLDPSAFQAQTDPRALTPPPPGAITMTTSDGTPFYAPAGTDFNEVYKAGENVSGKPLRDRLEAAYDALKHDGTYDYQRKDKTFNGTYRRASNFAVGVYMNGAGFSWPETWALGSMYALGHGPPDIIPEDESWWRSGYDAGSAGKLP